MIEQEETKKETNNEQEITCPNCRRQVTTDSWEWADCGRETCDDCGCIYFYERIIEVTYSTKLWESE